MAMASCEGCRICIYWWLINIIVMLCSFVVGSQCAAFNDFFYPSWALGHVMSQGDLLQLKLDHASGAGFASKSTYLFGKANVQIKLVPGDSAGTVTAFYMSSQGDQHDEFDYEFLGNTSGEPYVVQTNVYSKGVGNREQRIYLWFDPTANFHSYSFLWNRQQAVFFVDDVPIRVFSNNEKRGVPYPQTRPMGIFSSIWNADDWATQGGRVKTDWSHAPFLSTYKNFNIDACKYTTGSSCSSWWDQPAYASLNEKQSMQLKWVHEKYMIYDYCKDSVRFPTPPAECA
uniref:Xyloglucan endotransglucosylase/hydrolase n=1 Tax=Picea sitchensis TaxID=3332 RepID=D5A8J4_PICSI|nr:unknown [Picea sitchensis]